MSASNSNELWGDILLLLVTLYLLKSGLGINVSEEYHITDLITDPIGVLEFIITY